MGKYEKLLSKILKGTTDANLDFSQVCQLLIKMGFSQRVKGDHFIFSKDGIEEIINIQPLNSKAKAYQIKQIRNLIIKYKLGDRDVN
jgi:predicted RNA binding protein YcfA (HicA-like mRNA interferase family)